MGKGKDRARRKLRARERRKAAERVGGEARNGHDCDDGCSQCDCGPEDCDAALVTCPGCGERELPELVCQACGRCTAESGDGPGCCTCERRWEEEG